MVSGSAPAAFSFLVTLVVLRTGRGWETEASLSSWHSFQHLFSEKKPTPWLAVSKTTAFCGNAAPLYPWTSCAGWKMSSISMCGNSPLLRCVTLQPGKARLGLSPAVLADDFVRFVWREAHRDMQGPGMCHVSLVHPWALAQPPTTTMPSSVCCLQGWSVSSSTRST